jgi:hypothetical protein
MSATSPLVPDPRYAEPADPARVDRAAAALQRNGITAIVVPDRAGATSTLLGLLPDHGRIFTSTSRTLDTLEIPRRLAETGRFELVRDTIAKMDRATQGTEIRRAIRDAELVLGSVHAVTEDGIVLIASATGSQLVLYADSGVPVVWVVGAQKVVATVEEGLKRMDRYSFPLEDARLRAAIGKPSSLNKILLIRREAVPGRATMILVREALGF